MLSNKKRCLTLPRLFVWVKHHQYKYFRNLKVSRKFSVSVLSKIYPHSALLALNKNIT